MRAFRKITAIAALLSAPALARDPAAPLVDRFAGRDGGAEALADLKAGLSTRLFVHQANRVAPGYGVPGIAGCWPDVSSRLFIGLPEADWWEGVNYTREQQARRASALRFAEPYNRAMFSARRSEVLRVCPRAQARD